MPRFNEILQSFQNGEVSPKMWGRTDTDMYKRACKNVSNMIIQSQGGASRRPGTYFLDQYIPQYASSSFASPLTDVRTDMPTNCRLIAFNISDDESYTLILGQTDPQFAGSTQIAYRNNLTGRMMSVSVGNGAASLVGNATLGVDLTDTKLLKEIQYCAKGDVLFMFHPTMVPIQIVRVAYDQLQALPWHTRPVLPNSIRATSQSLDAVKSHPYIIKYNTDSTITASATTGTVTLTSSTAYFTSDMVGTPMAVVNSGTVGYVVITAYTSSTVVTAGVIQALPGTSAYTAWYESAWSPRQGWPRTGAFYNGSLIVGDTVANPGTLYRSQIGDIYEFTNDDTIDPGASPTDADPVSYTIASEGNNSVSWMSSDKNNLLVGTSNREYAITAFSRTEIDIRPQSSVGSSPLQPVVISSIPIFVQKGGRKINEMIYQERLNGYVSPETTGIAEHITRKSEELVDAPEMAKIKGMCVQSNPNNTIWVWDTNGYLYACTRTLDGEITAWHRHEVGGVFGSNDFAYVESVSVSPNPSGGDDEVYLAVKRTIDGNTKTYLEKLAASFSWFSTHPDSDTKYREPIYLDSAKVFRPSDVATFGVTYRDGSTTAQIAGGTATGTTTGTIALGSGYLMPTSGSDYVSYDGTSNIAVAQTGCIRLKLLQNEFANTNYYPVFTIAKADSDDDNLIYLEMRQNFVSSFTSYVWTTFRLTIKSSTGSAIVNAVVLGSVYGTINSTMDLELNYDLTGGATRLFVNGKQLGSTIVSTGTRDTSIDLFRIGGNIDGSAGFVFGISDVLFFPSVQHTEDFELYEYQESGLIISELDYLEGETVGVLGDGKYLGTFEVSSGSIALENVYDTVIVGLPYSHYIEPLSIEAGSGVGSSQGRPTRVDTIAIKFWNTSHCKFGRDLDNQEEIPFRDPTENLGEPISLFTGEKVFPIEGDYLTDTTVVISGDDPLPCNVTALVLRGMTNDG